MYEKLNKKARSLMLVSEIILCTVLAFVLLAVWLLLKQSEGVTGWVNLLLAAIAVCYAAGIITPFIRYERYRYRFTDEEIDVKEGVLFVTRNVVPIERLHKISMHSGPLDRMFGLSKVVVTTAGGDVLIRFLEQQKAEELVGHLKNRINSYAVESRRMEAEKRAQMQQQYSLQKEAGQDLKQQGQTSQE